MHYLIECIILKRVINLIDDDFYDFETVLSRHIPFSLHLVQIAMGRFPQVLLLLFCHRLSWSAVMKALPRLHLDKAHVSILLRNDVDFPYDASFNTITR